MRPVLERSFAIAMVCALVAFVAVASYGSIGYGRAILKAYLLSNSWQSTVGTIEASSAAQDCGRIGIGYSLKVRYVYVVNATTYKNDQVWLGNGYCSGKSDAESMAAKYLVGSATFVYFNPAAPTEAVLVKGRVENGTVFLFLLLASVPLGSAFLVFTAIAQARRQASSSLSVEQVLARRAQLDRSVRIEMQERTGGQ